MKVDIGYRKPGNFQFSYFRPLNLRFGVGKSEGWEDYLLPTLPKYTDKGIGPLVHIFHHLCCSLTYFLTLTVSATITVKDTLLFTFWYSEFMFPICDLNLCIDRLQKQINKSRQGLKSGFRIWRRYGAPCLPGVCWVEPRVARCLARCVTAAVWRGVN